VRRGDEPLGREGLSRLLAFLAGLAARALAQEAQSAVLDCADRSIGDDFCLLVIRPKALAAKT
jgi:hypothetical protein